ncbi:hypothetical protein N7528_000243 [Penicillium herquei]|nr:hypothetical protein N7528_000243 [Penicillium herquei]
MQPVFNLYVVWSEGLEILLNAGFQSDESSLIYAIVTSLFESVRLLLFHENSRLSIGYYELEWLSSVRCRSLQIQELVVGSLAKRRKKLQNLAETHLPSNILAQFRLRPNTLLGYHAGTLWYLLKSYGVEINHTEEKDWLVYKAINWDVQLAEVLWNAGFKDVNESTDKGFTCFMFHSSREIYKNNPESFARFVSFTNWLIEKGADPYCKRLGPPALHYIAEEFGFHFIVPSYVNLNPDPVESPKLMRLLQEDSHQDSCVCACSRHGCCAVTRFVQGSSMLEMRQYLGTDQILPDWYKYPTLGIDTMFDANPDALFRALTFEALEIRHTCEHYYTPKEPDEVKEIQHEWEERIQLLEKLTDEFVFAYEQSNLSIFDFLEKEWKIRMEKILFTSRSSRQKEICQLREIGVVLEDIDSMEEEELEESEAESEEKDDDHTESIK